MATEPSNSTRRGRHEQTDARPGVIFALVFVLAIGGVAIHVLLRGALTVFERQKAPADQLSGISRANPHARSWTNRYPRLQVNPPLDFSLFRSNEAEELRQYAWIDRSAGTVQIPVDRAMDLLLKLGMPERFEKGTIPFGASPIQLQQQRASQTAPREGWEK